MTFYPAEPAAKGVCSSSPGPCEQSIDLLVYSAGGGFLAAAGGPPTGNLLPVSCPYRVTWTLHWKHGQCLSDLEGGVSVSV